MTSGLLTDADHRPDASGQDSAWPDDADDAGSRGGDAASAARRTALDAARRRLGGHARPDATFWVIATLITLLAATLRFLNLAHPPEKIFDELYYAEEAHDLLNYGVEWNPNDNTPQYVVHPPLGKWMIALGEQMFGYNAFGWRFMAALCGSLSILFLMIIAQRLFRSMILAAAAGLLMAMDGMHFVLSRTALLDIFLMFFIVVALMFLVLDREQRRARWLAALESGMDTERAGRAGRARPGIPWWRLAAAVALGCAGGVKWSAIWYILAFLLIIIIWEIQTRRSAGVRHPIRDAFLDEIGWLALVGGIMAVVYVSTWSGWFLSDTGYFRHYRADIGQSEMPIIGALQNLYHYHHEALKFHTTLSSPHQYQSWPWQWLLLGRPVAFYWNGDGPCGGPNCASEILLLGTPLLWWSFVPALGGLAWLGVARRDWRAGLIGLGVFAGIAPWFWNMAENRTMFYFYALPAVPFLVLAVVYVLGAIIGPSRAEKPDSDHRLIGAAVAGLYMILIAACFAYFYPIYAGIDLTHAQWYARMWLGSRWI